MLARPPVIGTSAEVLEAPLFVDPDRGGIPFAAGNPRDKDVVLSAGKLVDSLYIALAPIENPLTGPVVQVIEGQFAQNGVDGFHFLLVGCCIYACLA
jgi:hypothetical protein